MCHWMLDLPGQVEVGDGEVRNDVQLAKVANCLQRARLQVALRREHNQWQAWVAAPQRACKCLQMRFRLGHAGGRSKGRSAAQEHGLVVQTCLATSAPPHLCEPQILVCA